MKIRVKPCWCMDADSHGLTRPDSVLDCGNSGTTTRLISGILSAQSFDVTLTGDASIRNAPWKRIMEPLSQMGARITSVHDQWLRTAFHPGKSFARHPLYFQSSFRPGKILDSNSRTLRRRAKPESQSLTFPAITARSCSRSFGADIRTREPPPSFSLRKSCSPTRSRCRGYFFSAFFLCVRV